MKFYCIEPPNAFSTARILVCEVTKFIVKSKELPLTQLYFNFTPLPQKTDLIYSKIKERRGVWTLEEFLKAELFFVELKDALAEFENLLNNVEANAKQAREYFNNLTSP